MRPLLIAVAAAGCSFSGAGVTADEDAGVDAPVDANVDAAIPLGECAAAGVVRDDFDDPIRSSYWFSIGDGITLDGSTVSFTTTGFVVNEFVGFFGQRWVDFADTESTVEVVEVATNGAEGVFAMELEPLTSFGIRINSTSVIPYSTETNGMTVEPPAIAYNAELHRFLRIRASSGVVYFEARGQGQATWTELFQTPAPSYVSAVRPVLGTFSQAIPSAANTTFDSLNVDVIESQWCSIEELDAFVGGDARFHWVPFAFDQDGSTQCGVTAAFDAGTVTVRHFVGSSGCVAAVDSRQLYTLDDGTGVSVDFTRQILGSSTRGFLELVALEGANPRINIDISDTQLCARIQTSGPVVAPQCVDLIAQTRIGMRRVGEDVVFSSGTRGSLLDFATLGVDASMPLKVGIGAESFGVGSNPSSVEMTFSDFGVDLP